MLKSILSTATFRESQITVLGTLMNGLLGFIFYISLARFLGPADFGLFIVATTTMVLIADIADTGTNTGLVRFVSKNLAEKRDKAYKFLKLCLEVKLFAWVISFLIIFFLAPFLAVNLFHKSQLILPLRLVAFGVGGALFFTYATSALQAYQKYLAWSTINVSTNFLRLILILIFSSFLTVENSLLTFVIFPFFGFFIALFILPTKKIILSKNEFSLSGELCKYNIPVAIFTIIASISSKLDTYLTAALLSSKEVGIYGAANQLVQVMPQLVSALGLVASPKFASFTSNGQMFVYFKKFQLFVLGLIILGFLAIPLLIYTIPLILGEQYQQVVTPFIFLFIAQLVFLFSLPVHQSVIFYFGRPDVFIWVSLGHLILIGSLGYLLILRFGVLGTAMTVLVGTTFNFLYPLIWLLITLRYKSEAM